MSSTCQKTGCTAAAAVRPVLMLGAIPNQSPDTLAHGDIGLKLCLVHSTELDFDYFMPEHEWLKLQKAFIAAGKMAPQRAYSHLRWEVIQ